jgi:hypothetical protein
MAAFADLNQCLAAANAAGKWGYGHSTPPEAPQQTA